MSAYGFSFYAPVAVRYGLELSGFKCFIIRTPMDSLEAARRSDIQVLLWENLSAFSATDYSQVDSFIHIFFSDIASLNAANITILDSCRAASSVNIILDLVNLLRSRDTVLDTAIVSYLHNRPNDPETLFSREVKKTQGKKKKDTSPVFLAGSSLRQGIKEILDMCGHNNEIRTYRKILSYFLFLDSGYFSYLHDFTLQSFQDAFASNAWSSAESLCLQRAHADISELTKGRPILVEGFSFEEHTNSALTLLSEWLHSKYAPYAIYGYYKVLSGIPEGRALYESNCDPSSLSLLCRNMEYLRNNVLSMSHFYQKLVV